MSWFFAFYRTKERGYWRGRIWGGRRVLGVMLWVVGKRMSLPRAGGADLKPFLNVLKFCVYLHSFANLEPLHKLLNFLLISYL